MQGEMPIVYTVLDRWVVDNASKEEAKLFQARWRSLRPGLDALPCPSCFLDEIDGALTPMDIESGVFGPLRPWVCQRCNERFHVPMPD
jgi:hypothetical protein